MQHARTKLRRLRVILGRDVILPINRPPECKLRFMNQGAVLDVRKKALVLPVFVESGRNRPRRSQSVDVFHP